MQSHDKHASGGPRSHRAGSALPPFGGSLTAPGKELTFVHAPAGRLRFHEDVGHDAAPVPLHRHLWQTERFTVLHGHLTLTVDGRSFDLDEGDSYDVPPRTLHTYAPSVSEGSFGSVLIEVEIWPAMRAGQFFETIYALTTHGGLPPRNIRDVLRLFALSHAHGFMIGGLPVLLMRVASAAGAAVATLLRIDHWSPQFAARNTGAAPAPPVYLPRNPEADP